MFCTNCGKELTYGVKFCSYCGAPTGNTSSSTSNNMNGVSPKSRAVAALLAFFFGGLGIHRFYVGKTGTGVLQILLTFCFGIGCIWAFIDFIIILCGAFRDKNNLLVSSWDERI